MDEIDIETFAEELAKMDPAELRDLFRLPAVQKILQNVLDEPLSEETQKRLQSPLRPKPFQLRAPPRRSNRRQELLRLFDPFPLQNSRNVTDYQNEILNLYDDVARFEGEEAKGRRYIRWRFTRGLGEDHTPQFMEKIRENVRTSFYMRQVQAYRLKNREDGAVIIFYKNQGYPWMNNLEEAARWLKQKETQRLDKEDGNAPTTKWEPLEDDDDEDFSLDLKVVLDRAPLMGTGPLPDWLRNLARGGHAMVGLDTYQDNLCLWRCIAVHRGSRPDRSTTVARGLAKSFFKLETMPTDCPKTSLDELDKLEKHLNQGAAFADWLGIRVYVPEKGKDAEAVWHLTRNPAAQLKNIMTIGVFEGHAFLIKDVAKLVKTYACVHCNSRLTKAVKLQRHVQTCAQGKTVIECPGKKVEAPETAYEKAFYPKAQTSKESLRWLEQEAKRRRIRIHHAMSGHGGERWLERAPVDGYNPETRTVFQFHGCYWHGCPKCHQDRDTIIHRGDKTREDLFEATKWRTDCLRKAGYRVVEAWACEVGQSFDDLPRVQTKSYPHAILYDFEAYGDNNQRKEPKATFTIENKHVPISVSIGDTLETEPTHICDKDPAELVRKFMEELERRGKNIRTRVRAEFRPADIELLPKAQRNKIEEWCDQVPVVGFNSGTYDLNLIKNHFAERLADTTGKVRVAKNGNKIMFLLTGGFRFLDIINYLGPGTSYEKWVKAYECKTVKSWFPYEWFDAPEKLDYPGLPEHGKWYSKLKGEYVLTQEEWEGCQRLFKENGMQTFADWLCYYNNLNVAPGLEALEKMRNFYTEKGIDILKDAVSVPGVSLHYLLRGAVERNTELYAPSKEVYEMLKEAVVGGPSLVFTRYHEVGITPIRSHQIPEPRICKKILG